MHDEEKLITYRRLLTFVSILLIAVLAVQCLYWTGVFSKGNKADPGTEAAGPAQAADPGTEAAGPAQAAEAGTGAGQDAGPAGGTGTEAAAVQTADAASPDREEPVSGGLSHEGYTLDQVLVLSRHNIRSPLSGPESILGRITPHQWFEWTSNPSELSLRGGALETINGQYFRKWLESEGLFPENYRPDGDQVRFYANSKQRTIATARYFASGLLPTAQVPVEYHAEYDQMDPVFNPQLTFVTDEYAADVTAQVTDLFADDVEGLADNCDLLEDVIDLEDSEAYRDGTVSDLVPDGIELNLQENAEPRMTGNLGKACTVSDALVLQYYEEPDPKAAAFGKDLSRDEWEAIGEVKDVYGDVLFASPLVSVNAAHPLLQEIRSELGQEGRKFTFLCGHDSNIGSVLAALGAEEYSLPDTIEKKAPIGCKLVLCRWRAGDGSEKMSIDLVYQTTDQLRNLSLLNLSNPPAVFPISLEGIRKDPDGLYDPQDVLNRLDEAIGRYDELLEEYALDAAA